MTLLCHKYVCRTCDTFLGYGEPATEPAVASHLGANTDHEVVVRIVLKPEGWESTMNIDNNSTI